MGVRPNPSEITPSQFVVETHEVSKDTWDLIYWALLMAMILIILVRLPIHPFSMPAQSYDIIKWSNAVPSKKD